MGLTALFYCFGQVGYVLDHDHSIIYLLDCFFAVSVILIVFDGLIKKV